MGKLDFNSLAMGIGRGYAVMDQIDRANKRDKRDAASHEAEMKKAKREEEEAARSEAYRAETEEFGKNYIEQMKANGNYDPSAPITDSKFFHAQSQIALKHGKIGEAKQFYEAGRNIDAQSYEDKVTNVVRAAVVGDFKPMIQMSGGTMNGMAIDDAWKDQDGNLQVRLVDQNGVQQIVNKGKAEAFIKRVASSGSAKNIMERMDKDFDQHIKGREVATHETTAQAAVKNAESSRVTANAAASRAATDKAEFDEKKSAGIFTATAGKLKAEGERDAAVAKAGAHQPAVVQLANYLKDKGIAADDKEAIQQSTAILVRDPADSITKNVILMLDNNAMYKAADPEEKAKIEAETVAVVKRVHDEIKGHKDEQRGFGVGKKETTPPPAGRRPIGHFGGAVTAP